MANDGLRRFLHLERPRPAGAEEPHRPDAAGRFDGVRRPPAGPGPHPAGTGASLERFGPEPEPSIQLADPVDGAAAATRCMRCGAENGAFATRCVGCEADLDTPQQHAFSEKLWARRQEDRAREEAALAERHRMLERAQAEEARARRELSEATVREVGDAERRRLEVEDARSGWGTGWGGGWEGSSPAGLRLLRLISSPRLRIAVAVAAFAVPVVLLVVPSPGARQGGILLLLVMVSLFAPPSWARRRRRWGRWGPWGGW
jgi:hypothetical protein